jgi:hypothetical protein
LFSGSVFFTHVVSIGLLYSIAKHNVNVGQFIQTAAKLELLQFILWLILPFDNLAIVLTLWFCLRTYEQAVGIPVDFYEKTSFLTGEYTPFRTVDTQML